MLGTERLELHRVVGAEHRLGAQPSAGGGSISTLVWQQTQLSLWVLWETCTSGGVFFTFTASGMFK